MVALVPTALGTTRTRARRVGAMAEVNAVRAAGRGLGVGQSRASERGGGGYGQSRYGLQDSVLVTQWR